MKKDSHISVSFRATAEFFRTRSAFCVLLVSAAIVGGTPVLLAVLAPSLNNAVVIAICASGQFFVSIFAGIAWSKAQAVKEANLRWVPMAASACDRLATILGSVSNLRATVAQACGAASKNLPELAENKNRAVRIHFEGLCSSNATRLSDVESHLDSALTDWERFIKHNCTGPECADIGRRLAVLRSRLSSIQLGCASTCDESAPALVRPQPVAPQRPEQLELMVNGVTATAGANGRWILRNVEEGYWECDKYILRREDHGWFVEDKSDSDSYFFRTKASTQCGVYERCEVCPHDGIAVVFRPSAALVDVALPGDKTQEGTAILNLAIALCPQMQHAMHRHCVAPKKIVTAVTEASNLTEYLAMLGIQCHEVVSMAAVPALNAMRQSIGREAFKFDPALYATLCARASERKRPAVVPWQNPGSASRSGVGVGGRANSDAAPIVGATQRNTATPTNEPGVNAGRDQKEAGTQRDGAAK